jgi:hypothetical protein
MDNPETQVALCKDHWDEQNKKHDTKKLRRWATLMQSKQGMNRSAREG